MPRGGARSNAGRKPGGQNQKSREIADRAAAEGITPLEVMLGTMRKLWDQAGTEDGLVAKQTAPEKVAEARLQAIKLRLMASEVAKDAAPFVHPRLSNIEANVSVTGHEAALGELD